MSTQLCHDAALPCPRGPLEEPKHPWPVGSALPEMPHGSGDLSTTLTCIKNQSPTCCRACWVKSPPQPLTSWLIVKQLWKGALSLTTRSTSHVTAVQWKAKNNSLIFVTLQFWCIFNVSYTLQVNVVFVNTQLQCIDQLQSIDEHVIGFK